LKPILRGQSSYAYANAYSCTKFTRSTLRIASATRSDVITDLATSRSIILAF